MDAYETIRQAIRKRQQVVATYKGHRREMCPHVIGRKGGGRLAWFFRRSGRRQALFFQFAGGSNSGVRAGGEWRCMSIDELTDVSVRPGGWHTGERHSRPQTCVDVVDERVAVYEEATDGWQTRTHSDSSSSGLTNAQMEQLVEAVYRSEEACYQYGDDDDWCQQNLRIVDALEPYASAHQRERIQEAHTSGHRIALFAEHG